MWSYSMFCSQIGITFYSQWKLLSTVTWRWKEDVTTCKWFLSWELELLLHMRSRSQGPPSIYLLSIFITPSSSLQSYRHEMVEIKHIWLCFLEIHYLHRLNLVWCVCIMCLWEKTVSERVSSWMNLSLHSSAPHLFPETKTNLGAVSRKKVGKPSCRLEFVHIKYVEKQTHLNLWTHTHEAHLVVCGFNGGMLTT